MTGTRDSYLIWIRACWQCDGCGKAFTVEVDSGWRPPANWTLDEIAKDAVRHGRIPNSEKSSSVQHDMVLCGDCTDIADAIGGEDHRATKDEIIAELGTF